MPEKIKNGDVKIQIPMHHTDWLFLHYSVLIYLLLLLLRVPRSISVHVCTCECVNVPLCVCARARACVRVLVWAQHGEVHVWKLEDGFSRAGSLPPQVSLSSLQLYYVPQASEPVTYVWAPVSPSHPSGWGECWVCKGNRRLWVFMWALGDSTQVHLRMEPSLWPPDSLLLKVATKIVIARLENTASYLWRRARPHGACSIQPQGRQHNPRVVSGLKDNGHLCWRFITRVTSIVIQ